MHYKRFGKTDLQVSEIGFGAWAIGGSAKVGGLPIGWGHTDDAISTLAIDAALEAGINFFDTADFYGLGHSEDLLGKTLKKNKDVIIATKVGQRVAGDRIVTDASEEYILKACEDSLRRLKRETIDYYQLHTMRMQHLLEGECIEAMERLKAKGKIRYWGISLNTFHPDAEAEFFIQNKIGDGFQLVFNLVNQRAFNIVKNARANGYGIIARMPLQFGLLTGRLTSETRFSEEDHRSFRLTPGIMQQALSVLENKVWPVAQKEGLTKIQLALSFILSFEGINTAIAGIRTADQALSDTQGLKILNESQIQYLQSLALNDWKPIMEMMEKQG